MKNERSKDGTGQVRVSPQNGKSSKELIRYRWGSLVPYGLGLLLILIGIVISSTQAGVRAFFVLTGLGLVLLTALYRRGLQSDDKYYKSLEIVKLSSFVLANVLIGVIFYLFTSLNLLYFLIISGFAFSFSVLLLKTEYFIATTKFKINSKNEEIIPKFRPANQEIFAVFFKLMFFNIMNDLFMVLVCWLSFFGVFSMAAVLISSTNPFANLEKFVSVITLISVVSGFFQYYIKNYKENITNTIMKSITRVITGSIDRNISFEEFLKFVEKKDRDFARQVRNSTSGRGSILPLLMLGRQRGKIIQPILFPLRATNDAELFALVEISDIDRSKLERLYAEFFDGKKIEIKEEIRKKINIGKLRKLLLPHIQFFDELTAEMFAIEEVAVEAKEEPRKYQDFLNEVVLDSFHYLIELLEGNQGAEEKSG